MQFGTCVLSQCNAGVQIDRCFGFETAVEEAQRALLAAKVRPQTVLPYCCDHLYPHQNHNQLTCPQLLRAEMSPSRLLMV